MNSNICVYSFADATGLTQYVDDNGDFNFTGTWSNTGTYVAATRDVVTYSPALYICIRDNIGDNPRRTPTRTRPTSWSVLSLLYEYQCSGTDGGTAEAAYALAQIGTNAAAAAQSTADSAYLLAQTGTNYFVTGMPRSIYQVGTTPSINGTATYDFNGSHYQRTTVDSDLFLTTVNMAEGCQIEVILIPDGNPHTLVFDNFTFFEEAEGWYTGTDFPIITDKVTRVRMTAMGNTKIEVYVDPILVAT